ncbi:MAG: hypothetical protein ACLU0O_01310 [Collinsella sp.]
MVQNRRRRRSPPMRWTRWPSSLRTRLASRLRRGRRRAGLAEIKFSISSNRGCFGECSFCALTFHQGRVLQMRSHDSIMREAELLTRDPEFKGYINDVGGPTANFSRPACDKQLKHGVCKNKRCLWPSVQEHGGRRERLHAVVARPAPAAGRQEGLRPQRYPF